MTSKYTLLSAEIYDHTEIENYYTRSSNVTNTALIADNNVNIFSPSKVNVSQCTSRTIKLNRDIYKFILDIASKILYTKSDFKLTTREI